MEKLAIGLYSGGLDSILAAKLVVDQGFYIILVKYVSPVFETRRYGTEVLEGILPPKRYSVQEIEMGADFLSMIQAPKYGYGKNMNPCLDCKILMVKKAGQIMKKSEGAFVFTG